MSDTLVLIEEPNEKNDLESNKIRNGVENTDKKMTCRRCPICGSPMHKSGQLQMTNPSTSRRKMVQVYYCSRCGYKTLG